MELKYTIVSIFLIILTSCYKVLDVDIPSEEEYVISAFIDIKSDSNIVEFSKLINGIQKPVNGANVYIVNNEGEKLNFDQLVSDEGVYLLKQTITIQDSLKLILEVEQKIFESNWESTEGQVTLGALSFDTHLESFIDDRGKNISEQYIDFLVNVNTSKEQYVYLMYSGIYKIESLPTESKPTTPVCWFYDHPADYLNVQSINGNQTSAVFSTLPLSKYNTYNLFITYYVINTDAYNYWMANQSLRTIEGSIFDPLPSEITGNIKESSSGEHALGYFTLALGSTSQYALTAGDYPIDLRFSKCYRDLINNSSVADICFDCTLINNSDSLRPSEWIDPS